MIPTNMSNYSSLTSAQLRRAADIQEQIEALKDHLAGLFGGNGSANALETAPVGAAEPVKTRKKYQLSAAGRAKKVAAQKARWAKTWATAVPSDKTEAEPMKERKKLSAASKAKMAAAAKARWAKIRAENAAE